MTKHTFTIGDRVTVDGDPGSCRIDALHPDKTADLSVLGSFEGSKLRGIDVTRLTATKSVN